MRVQCPNCGGAHPLWECPKPIAPGTIVARRRIPAGHKVTQADVDELKDASTLRAEATISEGLKAAHNAYVRSYMREYMRDWRAKQKPKS